jgi:hypothetical protein
MGIRNDPRVLYITNFKGSCTIDCNESPGIDAGVCVRESFLSPTSNILSSSQAAMNTRTTVRCLPSFVIAGVMKSGTGELMKWLDRHPNLKVGKGKVIENEKAIETNEVHFFGDAFTKSTCKWLSYLQFFPDFGETIETVDSSIRNIYTFEKSPDYVRSEEKIKQMKELLPNLRLLIILRNPVTRAISGFDHNCRHGRYVRLIADLTHSYVDENSGTEKDITLKKGTIVTTDSFPFLLDPNDGTAKYETIKYPCQAIDLHNYYFGERLDSDEATTNNKVVESSMDEFSYGFYDLQLEWVSKYFSKEHVKIIFQEEMYNNTLHTLREVELFLQIPCFDFTSIAAFPQANAPPIRKPETYTDRIGQIASSLQPWTKGKVSSSLLLQQTSFPETKNKLKEVYKTHMIRLSSILSKKFGIKHMPEVYF